MMLILLMTMNDDSYCLTNFNYDVIRYKNGDHDDNNDNDDGDTYFFDLLQLFKKIIFDNEDKNVNINHG